MTNVTKLKNSKCDDSKCDKTQILKFLQNSKTENMTKIKNWKFDKTLKSKYEQI